MVTEKGWILPHDMQPGPHLQILWLQVTGGGGVLSERVYGM